MESFIESYTFATQALGMKMYSNLSLTLRNQPENKKVDLKARQLELDDLDLRTHNREALLAELKIFFFFLQIT